MKKQEKDIMPQDSLHVKTKPIFSAIGARIKLLRDSAGLTQTQLADKIGMTRAGLSAIELGKNGTRSTTIKAIAEALDISVDKVLNGDLDSESITTALPIGPVTSQTYAYLRFVPIPARATFAEMGDSPDPGQFDTIAVPIQPNDDPARLEKCWVFEVNGDSMEPTVVHGQRIVAEPVNEGDWEYQSDRVFVVSYAGYLVVKRIKTNDLRKHNYLELWSDNEKKGGMKVAQRREIKGIWKVLRLDRAPEIY